MKPKTRMKWATIGLLVLQCTYLIVASGIAPMQAIFFAGIFTIEDAIILKLYSGLS